MMNYQSEAAWTPLSPISMPDQDLHTLVANDVLEELNNNNEYVPGEWNNTNKDWEIYWTDLVKEKLDGYHQHCEAERLHYKIKNNILNNDLIPTALELIHSKLSQPFDEYEYFFYDLQRKKLIGEIFKNHANWRSVGTLVKKICNCDPWNYNLSGTDTSFKGGHVANGENLGYSEVMNDILGWNDLVKWGQSAD
jgi:hypothetical protein